ncbi:hypothetical protein KCP70_08025 [Salmonella enterica subsp. enterica]|nr:hypothetical protein KCP70_08025 [Salmonella enterica subsp. enterica]
MELALVMPRCAGAVRKFCSEAVFRSEGFDEYLGGTCSLSFVEGLQFVPDFRARVRVKCATTATGRK